MRDLWRETKTFIPVVGHRGIRYEYPENTLISFEKAIELGVDVIEFDVNITKDNELIVIHDNTIDRTCVGHTGKTRDYTLKELKSFDFGSYKDDKFKGVTIPTLKEVLTLTKPYQKLLLNVEIKDYDHYVIDETIKMIKEFEMVKRVVVACFDAGVLRYIKEKYPEFKLQGFPGRYMTNFMESDYNVMFGMGIPIKSGQTDDSLKNDVESCKKMRILPWLWCADDEDEVKKCLKYKPSNITSNNPRMALKVLEELGFRKDE